MKNKRRMARIMLIVALIYMMIMLSTAGLCGQHFREVETAPVYIGGYMDYVRGVYIVKSEGVVR